MYKLCQFLSQEEEGLYRCFGVLLMLSDSTTPDNRLYAKKDGAPRPFKATNAHLPSLTLLEIYGYALNRRCAPSIPDVQFFILRGLVLEPKPFTPFFNTFWDILLLLWIDDLYAFYAIGVLLKDQRKGGALYRQSTIDLNGRSISFRVVS